MGALVHDHRPGDTGTESKPDTLGVAITVAITFGFSVSVNFPFGKPNGESDPVWGSDATVHANGPDGDTAVANQPDDHLERID
jgi:hypothetical protein